MANITEYKRGNSCPLSLKSGKPVDVNCITRRKHFMMELKWWLLKHIIQTVKMLEFHKQSILQKNLQSS